MFRDCRIAYSRGLRAEESEQLQVGGKGSRGCGTVSDRYDLTRLLLLMMMLLLLLSSSSSFPPS